jgi:dTDP-4-dehydrorhamnose 3,5-epimerase-like enzyme
MIFAATRLEDGWLIDIKPREDERGFFPRTWHREKLAAQGLARHDRYFLFGPL